MNYKIKKLYRNSENKQGKPYIAKGKYYDRVTLYLEGVEGGYSLNDFENVTAGWKEGDTKDLVLSEENGFKNFEPQGAKKVIPNVKVDGVEKKQLDRIEAKIDEIADILTTKIDF